MYRISPLQKNCKDEAFVQKLIPAIRQHFQRNATALDDIQLQLVLLHDMTYIDGSGIAGVSPVGFDYTLGFYLRFQCEGKSIELRCCVLAHLQDPSEPSFILVLPSPVR